MDERTLTLEQIMAYGGYLRTEERAPGTIEKYLRRCAVYDASCAGSIVRSGISITSYKYFSLFYLAGGSLCSTKSPPKSVQSLVSFFVFCSIRELVTGGPLCVFCCVFFEADGRPMNVKISDIAAPHKRPG